jgi:hypothetical protein
MHLNPFRKTWFYGIKSNYLGWIRTVRYAETPYAAWGAVDAGHGDCPALTYWRGDSIVYSETPRLNFVDAYRAFRCTTEGSGRRMEKEDEEKKDDDKSYDRRRLAWAGAASRSGPTPRTPMFLAADAFDPPFQNEPLDEAAEPTFFMARRVTDIYYTTALAYESVMIGLMVIHDRWNAMCPKRAWPHLAWARDGFHFERPAGAPINPDALAASSPRSDVKVEAGINDIETSEGGWPSPSDTHIRQASTRRMRSPSGILDTSTMPEDGARTAPEQFAVNGLLVDGDELRIFTGTATMPLEWADREGEWARRRAGRGGMRGELQGETLEWRIRRDGFASLDALTGAGPQRIVTEPLVFRDARATELFVNVRCAAEGVSRSDDAPGGRGGGQGSLRVRVDAADGSGALLSWSDPVRGVDSTKIRIAWTGKGAGPVARLRGRRIVLTFEIEDASLFSFWFASAAGESRGYVANLHMDEATEALVA